MKNILNTLPFLLMVLTCCTSENKKQAADPNLKLWYDRPATIWEEALPLGNGKTGAMVFGGVEKERFQLNDITLWSGMPGDTNSTLGPEILKKTRDAVFKGDYIKAAEEWKKISSPYCARYLPMGDLFLEMKYSDTVRSEYYRELDIARAISTVNYRIGGKKYQRESFISYPDNALITVISCNKGSSVSFDASLSSKLKFGITGIDGNTIALRGKAPWHVAHRDNDPLGQVVYSEEDGKGTAFEIRLRILNTGGTVSQENNRLVIKDADKVIIILASATSFSGFDQPVSVSSKDPSAEASGIIESVSGKTFGELKEAHLRTFQHFSAGLILIWDIMIQHLHFPQTKECCGSTQGKAIPACRHSTTSTADTL
jgi:alpha-L-fucosidase 2